MRNLTKAVALVILLGSASSQAEYFMYGHGVATCEQWNMAKEMEHPAYLQFQTWTHGFVSGVGKADIVLDETSARDITEFMDRYCNEYPQMKIEAGATTYLVKLGWAPFN